MTLLTLAQQATESGDAEGTFSLVEALPLEWHAGLAICVLGGMALWLFGAKIIKPIFGIAGVVIGGMIGMFALPAMGVESVFGTSGTLVGLGLGVLLGLVIAMVTLRAAIIAAAGLGFAAAGFLGGAIYLSNNPIPDENPNAAFEIDDTERSPEGRLLFENPYTGEKMTLAELTKALREANSFLGGGGLTIGQAEPAAEGEEVVETEEQARLRAVVARGNAIVSECVEIVKSYWNALAPGERAVIVVSTLAGLGLGGLIGFFMPKKASALITALTGSAIWLTAAGLLLEAFVSGFRQLTDQDPQTWAIVWGLAFLLGLVVQLAGSGKRSGGAKKAAKPEEDEDEEDEEDE